MKEGVLKLTKGKVTSRKARVRGSRPPKDDIGVRRLAVFSGQVEALYDQLETKAG